jgi:hypothetical protein
VHHRIIQINHQPDAKIFQFIILTFVYSSTCFGRFPAHHQGQWLQWQPLVLPSFRGDSRDVFEVGPAGPTSNINWKIVASGWWFIWSKCKTPDTKRLMIQIWFIPVESRLLFFLFLFILLRNVKTVNKGRDTRKWRSSVNYWEEMNNIQSEKF